MNNPIKKQTMKLTKENHSEVKERILQFVNHIEARERLVISMPYAHQIDRVEIYASETFTETSAAGEAFSGPPLPYIVTIQQYNNGDKKPVGKKSFSYKREFLQTAEIVINKLQQTL